jgi:hypothetical protein
MSRLRQDSAHQSQRSHNGTEARALEDTGARVSFLTCGFFVMEGDLVGHSVEVRA